VHLELRQRVEVDRVGDEGRVVVRDRLLRDAEDGVEDRRGAREIGGGAEEGRRVEGGVQIEGAAVASVAALARGRRFARARLRVAGAAVGAVRVALAAPLRRSAFALAVVVAALARRAVAEALAHRAMDARAHADALVVIAEL